MGTRHQPQRARSCELALHAVGAARGRPGGGASCLGVGRLGSGALPAPTARPLGRAAGAHYSMVVGAGCVGVGTRHQTHSACSCEIALRAVEAARARPGRGASCLGVGRPGSGALQPPTARPLGPAARAHYPLAVGAEVAGVENRHQPHRARSCELALRAVGAARGRPGGGASCLGVGRLGSGALPAPTARPLGRAAGAHYPMTVGAGGVGVGTRHQPHSARSCELALRAVGTARGRPGGGALAWTWGVRGRALSHPRLLVLSGVPPGPASDWLWVRGAWAWGPVTNPTARSCKLALRAVGAARGRPGWTPLAWAQGVRGRALSHRRPPVLWGARPGPTTHWLWLRGVWAWGPVTNPQRALLRAGFARCGGGTRAPGGGASCLRVGRLGSGALPTPTACPLGRAAGVDYLLAVGAGGAGVRTPHLTHRARSYELALRAVGAAQGRSGGAPLAWVWDVRGRALSHPRPLVLWGVLPGSTTYWLWVRGLQAWGPVTNPTARAGASWLCALWGRPEGARGGGGLAWAWGVRGRALSQPRPLVLMGVQSGPTTHWLWVRRVRAWGPVTNPNARALGSWLCTL